MNNDKSEHKKTAGCRAVPHLAWVVSLFLVVVSFSAFAANGETLAMLKVGEHTYHDVTVRTKAKDYILIVHSSGITSIKVTQLPDELREKLGYASAKPAASALTPASRAVAWAAGLKAEISQAWQRTIGSKLQLLSYPRLVALIAALMIGHLFCSYCCWLICQKIGVNPGILVWFPILQAVPMLRAASMSIWWSGAIFIPGLNLLGWVLWSIRIVAARQKTLPLAILLMFPPTSWFGFLFLAFSQDSRQAGTKLRVEATAFQSVCEKAQAVGVRALLHSEQHIAA